MGAALLVLWGQEYLQCPVNCKDLVISQILGTKWGFLFDNICCLEGGPMEGDQCGGGPMRRGDLGGGTTGSRPGLALSHGSSFVSTPSSDTHWVLYPYHLFWTILSHVSSFCKTCFLSSSSLVLFTCHLSI